MSSIQNFHKAKRQRKDDFYTQLSDIENELRHYRHHFEGKVVYCNCDDPKISNFYHYFSHNFNFLGLKKLVTTCYKSRQYDLFSNHDHENSVWLECRGVENESGGYIPSEPVIRYLNGDGDFRSLECIELLKQADIVVTNPPFSLFREYVSQLIEYDKKFVIIGNKNAISYKEIFSLIKDGKLWVGNTSMSKDMLFDVPQEYAEELVVIKKEGSGYKVVNGAVKGRAQAIWFTNLNHPKRNETLILHKRYSPEKYPKYDNYDAIEVSKTANIPKRYGGEMGVPVTFLDKHNPAQFEIIGMDRPLITELTGKQSRFRINGREIYARIVIRNKELK